MSDRYSQRGRFNLGLLIFVAVIGLPILAVPGLRARLSERTQAFYMAFGPPKFKPTPAWAKVGENRYPVPEEYVRPTVRHPAFSGVVRLPGVIYGSGGDNAIGKTSEGAETPGPPSISQAGSEAPQFRQGKQEQEAYDLLLTSNETVAGMVRGSNPVLTFKSWSAALQEEDAYLVDLTFLRGPEKAEVHYIWRVEVQNKKISPMSHEARSLSRK